MKQLKMLSKLAAILSGLAFLNGCPAGAPTPSEPNPSPTPVVSPSPTPVPFSCYLDGTKYNLSQVDRKESYPLGRAINIVISEETGCRLFDPACEIKIHPQDFMDHVIERLQKKGYCAGQLDPGESDEIAAAGYDTRDKVPGKIWHAFHIYSGNGWDDFSFPGIVVWYYEGTGDAPGSYRGTWEAIKK